jgi:hypothetical protein
MNLNERQVMNGGKRIGAGRPKGSTRGIRESKVLRVPLEYVEQVKELIKQLEDGKSLCSAKPMNVFPKSFEGFHGSS